MIPVFFPIITRTIRVMTIWLGAPNNLIHNHHHIPLIRCVPELLRKQIHEQVQQRWWARTKSNYEIRPSPLCGTATSRFGRMSSHRLSSPSHPDPPKSSHSLFSIPFLLLFLFNCFHHSAPSQDHRMTPILMSKAISASSGYHQIWTCTIFHYSSPYGDIPGHFKNQQRYVSSSPLYSIWFLVFSCVFPFVVTSIFQR